MLIDHAYLLESHFAHELPETLIGAIRWVSKIAVIGRRKFPVNLIATDIARKATCMDGWMDAWMHGCMDGWADNGLTV
jgi:hypothetical protein